MAGMIRGVVGLVKWGYYTAAAINGYTVERDENKQWSLSAVVVQSDAFKLKQKPLMFVAPTAKGDWTWPIQTETIAIHEGRFTARLLAPKER